MTDSSAASRRMSLSTRENSHSSGLLHDTRRLSIHRRPSLAGSHRTGDTGKRGHSAGHRAENTYQTGPVPGYAFNVPCVRKLLKEVLTAFLDGESYEYQKCAHLAMNLSEVIKSRLKDLDFPRYRYVCQVVVGQNGKQGMEYASRCIWNGAMDNYASVSYNKGNLIAVATVFGVYLE